MSVIERFPITKLSKNLNKLDLLKSPAQAGPLSYFLCRCLLFPKVTVTYRLTIYIDAVIFQSVLDVLVECVNFDFV